MNVWLLMMCHINSQYSFIWFPRGIPIDLVFLFKLFYTNGICILQGLLVDTFFLLLVVICPPPKLLDRPGWGRMLVPNECAKLLLRRIPGAKWWDGNTYILTLIMHFSQIWWRNFGQFRCIVWGTYCIHGVLVSNIYHFHTIFVVRLSYLTTVIFFETGWNHQLGFCFGWSHLSKVLFLLTIKILKVEARQHKLRQFALPPSFPPPKKRKMVWMGWFPICMFTMGDESQTSRRNYILFMNFMFLQWNFSREGQPLPKRTCIRFHWLMTLECQCL